MNSAVRRCAGAARHILQIQYSFILPRGFYSTLLHPAAEEFTSTATANPNNVSPSLPCGSSLGRPKEPDPEECCGRGCAECVWTIYWDDLKAYEAAMAKAQGRAPPLDPFEEMERRLAEQAAARKGATSD